MTNILKDKVVLLVEDERPLINAIKTKLEDNGVEVATAVTVDQALNYVQELEKIDYIWLDHYLLGEKNGLDFLVEIKQDEKHKNIPVFVVSNTGGHEKKITYMKLGASEYYIKSNSKLSDIIDDIKDRLSEDK
jgi:DNA-binding response OmpR family regulator